MVHIEVHCPLGCPRLFQNDSHNLPHQFGRVMSCFLCRALSALSCWSQDTGCWTCSRQHTLISPDSGTEPQVQPQLPRCQQSPSCPRKPLHRSVDNQRAISSHAGSTPPSPPVSVKLDEDLRTTPPKLHVASITRRSSPSSVPLVASSSCTRTVARR